ncbi:U5 small nuclear ribonucleoprotein 40 kDa protein [Babesia sp. Xinjiang]|uniref:U5 small nuclear ribonucleoprotein 40 kDa protein n=1 Tax=Babesia sp. Xinjiang TaxID=462227 RepID=UPI000A215AE4|nr:U5 small nuclear ribonucleoprotein 40 kDa protein [Babesia sp. Xinjiang]ORM40384.1 U5 small nuclear ribonucleoprotein 40 kDa protein [Babesia sp. Xinjiang]
MADKNLHEIAEKDAVNDDVYYLKEDCVVDEEEDDTNDKDLDTDYVCWNKEFGSELLSLSVHPTFPEIAHVAVGSRDDKCLVVDFKSINGGSDSRETTLGPFSETVSSCAYSPDGSYLALGCMDGLFLIYNVRGEDYTQMCTVNGPTDGIEWISWLSDNSAVMFGGSGHTVFIWDAKSETTACVSTKDNNSCGKFCTYNGSSFAVLGGDDGHLSIARYTDGSVGNVTDVLLHGEVVTCLDCHDTVQLAMAGLYDGGLYFVELSKNTVTASFLEDHTDTVESVKFCSGGSLVMAVSIGHDGRVITWDCERMAKLHVVMLSERLTRVVWVPSTPVVAVSSLRGKLYAIKNGKVLSETRPHKSTVLDIVTLPCDDEFALLSVSEDGAMIM